MFNLFDDVIYSENGLFDYNENTGQASLLLSDDLIINCKTIISRRIDNKRVDFIVRGSCHFFDYDKQLLILSRIR